MNFWKNTESNTMKNMRGIRASRVPLAWVRGAIGRAVGALDWMGGDDSHGSRGVAPGWIILPLRGGHAEIKKMNKPHLSPSSNAWKNDSLFAESKSLASEIKNQLAGVRYE